MVANDPNVSGLLAHGWLSPITSMIILLSLHSSLINVVISSLSLATLIEFYYFNISGLTSF